MTKTAVTTPESKPVAVVAKLVRGYIGQRQMILPQDYAVENALKAAWLMIQETKDRNGNPALQVCTQESVQNALLSMVLQGLDPDKKQCYFIVYGKSLACQRSYFGSQALVKRVANGDVFGEIVYKNDIFEYEIIRGQKRVTRHVQKLENVDLQNIMAAYATVVYPDGRENTVIMTMAQIKSSWGKSSVKPINPDGSIKVGTPHHDQPDQMAIRTATNRLCKPIINASNDSHLFKQYVIDAEDQQAEDNITEEIAEHANKQLLDIGTEIDEAQEQADADIVPVAPQREDVLDPEADVRSVQEQAGRSHVRDAQEQAIVEAKDKADLLVVTALYRELYGDDWVDKGRDALLYYTGKNELIKLSPKELASFIKYLTGLKVGPNF